MTDKAKKHTESYTDFLQKKHSAFNTPIDIINSIAQKAVSSKPVHKKKLILGEANEVYDITTANGQSIILRISHSSEPRFKEEKWALDHAREAGVPTPKVILIDQVNLGTKLLFFCVEEKLQGQPLKEIYSKHEIDESSKNLVLKAGRILAKIHSIKVKGFGQLDENGNGKFKSWEDYMLNDEKHIDEFKRIAKKVDIDFSYITQAFEILNNYKLVYQTIEPRLLHGDFSPKHLLVVNNEITGVIDMENCKGGDIARDFSWWDYFHRGKFPVEWLMEGYEDPQVLTQEFRTRVKLCGLQLGIILLYYYYLEKNQNGVNHAKQILIEDVKQFSFI